MQLHAAYVPADTAVTSGAPYTDGIHALAKCITVCTVHQFHINRIPATIADNINILIYTNKISHREQKYDMTLQKY